MFPSAFIYLDKYKTQNTAQYNMEYLKEKLAEPSTKAGITMVASLMVILGLGAIDEAFINEAIDTILASVAAIIGVITGIVEIVREEEK
jgi:hypothetical protein